MNIQRQEQIDAYLQGNLSAEERTHFEQQLKSDHTLREEVEMHRLMVEAICAERKASLKHLLDNTPVPHGPTFDFGAAQWWRWGAGAIALGGAVWLVVWLNREAARPVNNTAPAAVEAPVSKPESPMAEEQTTEMEKVPPAVEQATPRTMQTETKQEEVKPLPSPQVQPNKQKQPKQEQEVTISGTKPTVNDETTANHLPAGQPLTTADQALRDFEKSLFYQYNNRVLVLFKEVDYRLLQGINLGDGAKDYIFVNGHFYELKETGEAIENFENCRITDSLKVQMLKRYLNP
ncbi:MAG: hypothetical protein KatS3mg033_0639 [Thermonema sp.]|uniref:hypothetical protein n=1 Tax=Thermonema sp. TaxID=2231181 RepID=UPI0021DE65CB|nr:hypothetical protein [Thermonema sp.]GIV38839.1 MAG: hypothetical protein KatS3mg033_0639 [Thermonema sp.]